MELQPEITYKVDKRHFEQAIADTLSDLTKQTVLAPFKNRYVSAATVAEIHNIHRETVIKYAKAKLIPHTREGRLYKFCLATALEFDFHELRRIA